MEAQTLNLKKNVAIFINKDIRKRYSSLNMCT